MKQKQIFLAWLPLAAMWILMAIEQPGINAAIGRLADPVQQLAAFGVAFSLGLIVESPIIQLLSTGTALTVDMKHYRTILKYIHWMSIVLAAVHLLIALTPMYRFLVGTVLGVPEQIVEPSRRAFLFLAPWSPAIAYRRYFQGVLIRYGRSGTVALTMVARVVTIGCVLAIALLDGRLSGAVAGAITLTCGVTVSVAVTYLFVRPVVRNLIPATSDEPMLTLRRFSRFYIPLALTSFVSLAARPILTLGIARSPEPLESLAAWPLVTAFLFLVNSMALAYQEVVISLARLPNAIQALRKFTLRLSIILTVIIVTIVASPFDDWWFFRISGLDSSMREYTQLPMILLCVTPLLMTCISWFRGLLVFQRRTKIVTQGVVISTSGLILFVFIFGLTLPVPGVISAALAYAIAFIGEVLFLARRTAVGDTGRRARDV